MEKEVQKRDKFYPHSECVISGDGEGDVAWVVIQRDLCSFENQ